MERTVIEKLFEKNYKLWRYWLRQWGTPEDAIDDIIQEMLIALLRIRDKAISYLDLYARTILLRRRADYFKKSKNHPDLNRLYLRISEINAKIKNTHEKIKRIRFPQGKMERLAKLNEEISKLLKEKDEIGEQINEMNRRIREAKRKAEDSDQKDPSPTPAAILEEKQQKERLDSLKRALRDILPKLQWWEFEIATKVIFEGAKIPDLARQYGISVQKVRTAYNKFIRHIRKRIRTKRTFYEMYK